MAFSRERWQTALWNRKVVGTEALNSKGCWLNKAHLVHLILLKNLAMGEAKSPGSVPLQQPVWAEINSRNQFIITPPFVAALPANVPTARFP